MTRYFGRRSKSPGKTETQDRLHEALKQLFDLLEYYSPVWYKKQHHDQAESALGLLMTLRAVPLRNRHYTSKSHRESKQAA